MAQPFIPVPNVAKLEIFFRMDSQRIENVFSVQSRSFIFDTALMELAEATQAWVQGDYCLCLGAQATYTGVKVSSLEAQDGPIAEVVPTAPSTGAIGGGEPIPNNCAAVMSWKTALRGRSYRGRTYIPALRSTMLSANNLLAAQVVLINTAFDSFRGMLSENGWDLVVVSRMHNGVWRTTGAAVPVTTGVVNPVVASQRRRLPGRGA